MALCTDSVLWYQVIRMCKIAGASLTLTLLLALAHAPARAQAPSGPIAPKPGAEVQQPPKDTQAKVKVRVALVNTPVTVRDGRRDMVHNLEARDFQITDNGVAQQISHFDLGGDPVSMVILVETSSRIEPLLPQVRKTGILFTQTVMGTTGEAAVVSFNDSVDKLQDFTTHAELQAKPKDTRPQITPPGTFPLPPQPGVPQTPTSEENRYGNIDLMAAVVWAVQHIHDQVKDHALELAATATGGAHVSTFKDRSIDKAIDEIGGELHSQYTISYTPTASDAIGYHEIKVNVLRNDAKNLKVRARPGYYLAPPES